MLTWPLPSLSLILSWQRLESEKEALRVTAELLNVRLNSLSDILAIQEGEISNKVSDLNPCSLLISTPLSPLVN